MFVVFRIALHNVKFNMKSLTGHEHWGCGLNAKESQMLIAHGKEINYLEWPWITTIFMRHSQGINFRCGGSLVSARHVITGTFNCNCLSNLSLVHDCPQTRL
jgi:hypothetical protein